MAFISRDPFAREELHRESIPAAQLRAGDNCAWCGMHDARGRLYAYRIESDGGRTNPIRGRFCSAACMRTYHGH